MFPLCPPAGMLTDGTSSFFNALLTFIPPPPASCTTSVQRSLLSGFISGTTELLSIQGFSVIVIIMRGCYFFGYQPIRFQLFDEVFHNR